MAKRGKGRVAVKVLLLILLIAGLYVGWPYIDNLVNNPPSLVNYSLPERMNFTFERIITVQTTGTYTMNITVPQNDTLQRVFVSSMVEDSAGYSKEENTVYGRVVWSFHLNDSSRVTLHYNGTTYTKVWKISESEDVDSIPQSWKDRYNHREYINVYNSTSHGYEKIYVIDPYPFKNMTEKLTEGDKNVVEKLRSIYDVIVQNFQYDSERSGNPNPAVKVWNLKKGDCDELSFVFVSMARSIGIPAWVEYGPLYTGDSWVSHGWVGTVIPTENGIVMVTIDLTAEVGGENLGRGFLIRPADRLLEWRDDGDSEHLTSYYTFLKGRYTSAPIINQEVRIIKAEKSGVVVVSSEDKRIPDWIMLLIIGLIIVAAVALIIKL